MEVNLGGSFLSGNFPGGSYPGWELSGWELSLVRIVWMEVILSRNFLWWGFFGWELSEGNHLGGNFPRTCHSSFGSQLLNVFCNLVNKHVVEHTQISITYVVTTKQGKYKKGMTQPMSF